jgi:hypothetical protein
MTLLELIDWLKGCDTLVLAQAIYADDEQFAKDLQRCLEIVEKDRHYAQQK